MGRGAKGLGIVVLLAGIAVSVRRLSLGAGADWIPGLEATAERFAFRSLTLTLGLGAWFLSQSLIGSRGLAGGTIGDAVHDWTAPLHARLAANPAAANALLVATSGFIDLFGLFLLGSALFGPSVRPGIALILLFAFRQGCQLMCALPAPPGMIWRRPGFPSLLVTYGVSNDFFFSGHTAIAVLGAIEVARVAPWWAAAIAAGIALLEALAVLVLRAHWTMDVLAGVAAAFAAAGFAAVLCAGF